MAAKVTVSPLNAQVPIVDPKTGKPTAQFMQTWSKQLLHNGIPGGPTDAAGVSALLDLISDHQGDVLQRGTTSWDGAAFALAGLSDVDTTGEIDGYVLTYDAVAEKWKAKVATGGGGGGGVGPHRFWAIDVQNWYDGSYQGISHLEFRLAAGGAQAAVGGVGSSPRGAQAGATADIFTGTNWSARGVQYAGDSRTTLIMYDMGVGNTLADLKEWAVSPDADFAYRGPATALLMFSDDGQDWTLRSVHYIPQQPGVGSIAVLTVPPWSGGGGGGGGSTTLAALTDVNIPAPVNGQVLTFDAATSKWLAETLPGPAPTVSSTRWRLLLDATNNGNANTGFNGVEMRSSIGGAGVTPTSCTVDTTSFGSSANLPLFSTATNSFWVAPTGTQHYIEYDFATAISVEEVAIIMAQDGTGTSGPLCWPISIEIQYWTGTAWTTHWTESGLHPTPNTVTPIVYSNTPVVVEPALVELSDVAIMAPTDGQVVTWDATTSKWVAETPTGGGGGGGPGAATTFNTITVTNFTSGPFATVANLVLITALGKAAGLIFIVQPVTGAVYRMCIAPWDPSTRTLTAAPFYCDTVNVDPTTNQVTGTFSVPPDLALGYWAIMCVRTDAGPSPSVSIGYNASSVANVAGFGTLLIGSGGSMQVADIAPSPATAWSGPGGNPFGAGILFEPAGLGGGSAGAGIKYSVDNIIPDTSSGGSAAFAGIGNRVPFAVDCKIPKMQARLDLVGGATYKLGIAQIDPATNIMLTEAVYTDTLIVDPGGKYLDGEFTTPYPITAGNTYIMFYVRTDAGGTGTNFTWYNGNKFDSLGVHIPANGPTAMLIPDTNPRIASPTTWATPGGGIYCVNFVQTF